MTQIHPFAQLPVGLAVAIEEDDGLVYLGEFGIYYLLEPCNPRIVRGHDVRIICVFLLYLAELPDHLILLSHCLLSNVSILMPSPIVTLLSLNFRKMVWKGELDDLY